ncbi:MAG: D-serine ammonia-lyase [Clostridiales bacterium]|nr:D-serine ammonia-lyase [Clostridiales bacterium]
MSEQRMILGKSEKDWHRQVPIIEEMQALREVCWINPRLVPVAQAAAASPLTMADIQEAADRLARFAPYLMEAFPQTAATGGILESPLKEIVGMKAELERDNGCTIPGRLWLKMDSHLGISGSIKARGGIYEVLKTAEDIALRHGLLKPGDDYRVFGGDNFRQLFSRYEIAVGSTGNLGLSIGIMSAALGFRVTVHMSADARQWKKDLLRQKGVQVVEYAADYSVAIAQGRQQAMENPMCIFVDDENSQTLFLGYAAAALRLKEQLRKAQIAVDEGHPLFVYLPCGVGGGPGGVAFGLKMVFGDHVHAFFAEPTHAGCMLLGMATGLHQEVSVQDFGVDNVTVADGLAVGRPSGFVGRLMEPYLSGCYTLSDERMFRMLARLVDTEGIRLEPSALAGMWGPVLAAKDPDFAAYIRRQGLQETMPRAAHIVWATGGSMVPAQELESYYRKGLSLL